MASSSLNLIVSYIDSIPYLIPDCHKDFSGQLTLHLKGDGKLVYQADGQLFFVSKFQAGLAF